MKESKILQLNNLIGKIERVDNMVKLHKKNPSTFMLGQYQSKKDKLLSYLIDELIASDVRSPYSFKLILMALVKFYPEIQVNKSIKIKAKVKDRRVENLTTKL